MMPKLLCCILLFFSLCFSHANAISAKSAVVIDADTQEILFSQNCDEVLSMASTTKIMTAIIALENGDLSKKYTVKKEYTLVEGSSMYLKEGEEISLLDTLYGLMLMSGNDAALAIAGECGGHDEFVKMMNDKALELGLENTHFENPNGLDGETHHTTALELAKLTAYALKNPTFAEIVSTKTYTSGTRTMTNHNKLLSLYPDCIGVKTGYTKKSGRCLVSAATKNGRTLVAVTLNDPDDWNDHMQMLDNAFSKYNPALIQKSGIILGEIPCEGGTTSKIPYKTTNDITLYLTESELQNLTYKVSLRPFIYAPVKSGDMLGEIIYEINGSKVASDSLTLTESSQMLPEKLNTLERIFKIIWSFFDRIRGLL